MTVWPDFRMAALRLRTVVVLWLLACVVAGCGGDEPAAPTSVSGTVGETAWSVVAMAPPADMSEQALRETVSAALSDARRQVTGADAALQRFNQAEAGQWIDTPASFAALLQQVLAVGRETVGAYDVTRRPLLEFWGVLDTVDTGPVPAAGTLRAVRERTGTGLVKAREEPPALRKSVAGVQLYLDDLLSAYRARLLASRLQAMGASGWRIRFGDVLLVHAASDSGKVFSALVPTAEGAVRVVLGQQGAMASAVAPLALRLAGRVFPSVIDPRTGRPITHSVRRVTVLATDAVRASALAQALLVMGPRAGLAFANAQGIAARFEFRETEEKDTPLYSNEFVKRMESAATPVDDVSE